MRSERNVVLIGLGPTAASALEALRERFNVQALVRYGDDGVVATARAAGIHVEADTSIRAIGSLLDRFAPDAVVVSSYDRILPRLLTETFPFVNVHYAPLPRYRGRATVNWAILNGEAETAITVHCLEAGLDAGGILDQQMVAIGPRDTVADLYDRLNAMQRVRLAGAVERRLSGDRGTAQDESQASYSCTRVPTDGLIDWTRPTIEIDRLIRSLGAPFPAAYSFLELQQLEIHRARPKSAPASFVGRVPGRVVAIDSASGEADVLTGDGVLTLELVGLAGAEPEPAARVIRSHRATLGLSALDIATFIGGMQRDRPRQSPAIVRGIRQS
jgi:methionyl-tRNA formyltransferase